MNDAKTGFEDAVRRLPDESLLARVRGGDDPATDELLRRYRGFARVKARSYYLVGGDREDLVQEGMIGLYKAIRDYAPDRGSSFRSFAEMCIGRQILTAIKAAGRYKHAPLNGAVSLSHPDRAAGGNDDERVLADLLAGPHGHDPADLVIAAERIRGIQRHLDTVLSDLEVQVLRLYVDGKSYVEIADLLERHVKAIDNALQRIKRKLDGHLRAREVAEAG